MPTYMQSPDGEIHKVNALAAIAKQQMHGWKRITQSTYERKFAKKQQANAINAGSNDAVLAIITDNALDSTNTHRRLSNDDCADNSFHNASQHDSSTTHSTGHCSDSHSSHSYSDHSSGGYDASSFDSSSGSDF